MDHSPSTTPDRSGATTEPPRTPTRNTGSAGPNPERNEPAGPQERTRPGEVPEPAPGFRWTCPLCGESRIALDTGRTREAHVVNDLRSHVRAAAGGVHGARGAMPPGLDPAGLDRHVRRLGQ